MRCEIPVPRIHGDPKRLAAALNALPDGAVVVKSSVGNLLVVDDGMLVGCIDVHRSQYEVDIYDAYDDPLEMSAEYHGP